MSSSLKLPVEDKDMLPLQFITHHTERYSYLDSARMALEGGCKWIQLRMKDADEKELKETALKVQEMCKQHEATFSIDDHVELVKEIKADGVHLGKNDMPVAEARQFLGEEFLIGGTANTFDDIMMHFNASADYIGCGPFRFTTTKKNLSPILGLEGYKAIIDRLTEMRIRIPVVAIGGITYDDIPDIMNTGIHGIALSGTILNAANPVEETQRILNIQY